MAYMNASMPVLHTLGDRVAAFFADLKTAYAKHVLYNRTIKELSVLSERELNDLGLCYADIRGVAYRTVYHEEQR